ncbi:MAG: sodium-independent anion transporter [Betaproteobacteria bacterium HGW-Betaproteobacteria-14]|nr:MAG: sodium-independent anion transporter [Betaproteobacteria bacterium HGW-Betaproteobacteria-14]
MKRKRFPPWLLKLAPFLAWWPQVGRDTLKSDLSAGLIGAIIVLPQGVAFATLAGMPPQYGLYAAMVPAIVAALFGSSWHLVSGPTNAISLVIFATLSQLADPGSAKYIGLALSLTFLVGIMQLAMGLARLGQLVNFISHTVVIGFTAGAAVLIMSSQLRNFFGIPLPRGLSFIETLRQFVLHLADIKPWVLAVSVFTLVAGLATRRWLPKVPYMIVAMLAGSLLAAALNAYFGAAQTGIATVGALPGALPRLSMPDFSFDTEMRLAGIALAVTALGLTEAVSIARSIASKSGQRIDGNQEFIGQGLSNIVGSFFSAYAASGSFNRSGVNYEAGARTPLAAIFAALFLILVLLVVSPLAAYLPNAAMAAILFMVAWGLIDTHHIGTILRVSRSEAAVLAVTFFATLLMHLEMAIIAGVLVSLIIYLNRTARPGINSIVPDAADPARRSKVRKAGEAECPQLRILRIEGSLYFGAVNHVAEYLSYLADARPDIKHLLITGKRMNFIDIAGAELLAAEARKRRAAGGSLYLYGLSERAQRFLGQPPFSEDIGTDAIFATKKDAIAAIVNRFDMGVCANCKARIFNECMALPAPK